jgi:methylated-DNA-protein-cysteine methyltransferase-like protein
MRNQPDNALYERIYEVAEQVPRGIVATYGDIAAIVGGGCDARTVGYALGELPPGRAGSVPWQRIVAKEGGISTRGLSQRRLLEDEGVAFDARGRVIMARFHWAGPNAEWAAAHGFHTLPPRDEGEQLSLF